MASDAKTLLPRTRRAAQQITAPQPNTETHAYRTWPGLLLLGTAVFAFFSVLTQGLFLFDNDYDWIAYAGAEWTNILGRIFRPIPTTWGFQERPVQELCFKILSTAFGYSATPYYAFKGLSLAGTTCGIALFCLRAGLTRQIAFSAAALFALSGPVFPSALWVSDFELLAQGFMLVAFGLFLAAERHDLYRTDRLKFHTYQAGIFLFALLANRTKGSAKLIPVILLGYLLLYRREALKRHLPLLALIVITIVPIFHLIHNPIPPFTPFSEDHSQGWMWKPANLQTLSMLLFGNAHLLTGTIQGKTPHGLLATLCPILFWAALAAAGWLFYKRRNLRPLPRSTRDLTAFTVIWLGAVLASFSAFPRLPDEFMARYVTGALIPTGILVALLFNRAIGTLHKPMWTVPLVSLLVLAHGTVNFQHIRSVRDSLGQIMVAYGHARESISHTLRNSDIFILDFTYAYRRDLNDGNRYIKYTNASFSPDLTRPLYVLASIQGNPNRPNFAEIAQRISTHFPNLPRNHVGKQIGLRPVTVSSGLTDGIYNHWIYQNPQTISAVLFQVIFDPAALQEGTQP